MPKRNILEAATTFPRWKNDTEPGFVFELCRQLAGYGHNVIALAPHFHNAKKHEIIGNVKIYRFSYFVPYRLQKVCYEGGILANLKRHKIAVFQLPLLFLSEFFSMAKLIKKEKIDVVHAHWIIPQGVAAYLCKKLFGIPYIATAHAGDIFPVKSPILRILARLVIKNSTYCTANSAFTKGKLEQIFDKKGINLIPMGVDMGMFRKRGRNDKLMGKFGIKKEFILGVGRLVEKKGFKYLVTAMSQVVKEFPHAKLVIVGDGPERASLELLAEELGLGSNVAFAGKVGNRLLPEYYASADLFVGPSIVTESGDTEGLGVAFLEALASGTCVIGSNVGGIPDIINHNKTGLLVRQKNSEELANAIINLLSSPKLRKSLAFNGHNHIKRNYSWDLIGKKFNMLVESVK